MIFVDSGAWIALFNTRDQHHTDARVIYSELGQKQTRILTTDYVLDESVTRLRYDAGYPPANRFLETIERAEGTKDLVVARIDESVFEQAKRLFRQYSSERLSFTDCTSFVVCQSLEISAAFAFDRHFPIMGITLLQ